MQRVLALFSFFVLVTAPLSAACTFDLAPAAPYPAGVSPSHIEVADFNNDGFADVATRRSGTDKITILLGTSGGSFGQPSEVITGRTILGDIATGDLNGDNKIDLVTTNGWLPEIPPAVNVLLGNGDGTFQPLLPYTVFQNPLNLAVADFDKDGKLDIAATKSEGFVLLLGLGNGEVVQKSDNVLIENGTVGHDPTAIAHGDFDGDGKLDVAVAELVSNRIHVFYGAGDGSFARGPALLTSEVYGTLALTAGDFDGDKDDDLAWGEYDPSGGSAEKHLHVFVSSGAGRTFAKSANEYGAFNGSAAMLARTGDMDGDGDRDIVVRVMWGFQILFNDGTGAFPTHKQVSEGYAFEAAVADMDRDGGLDVVTTNFAEAGQIQVFRNACAHAGLTLTASPSPSAYRAGVTFTATLLPPPAIAPTGTLTLKRGETILKTGDASSLSLATTLSALPIGTHTITAMYSGDSRFAAITKTIQHVVMHGPFGAPSDLVATSTGGPVHLSWIGTTGVAYYEILRSSSPGVWSVLATTQASSFVDASASPSAAWAYTVRAYPVGSGPLSVSPNSNIDLASTFTFTDETVTPGTTRIRYVHLEELRNAANAARALAGLQPVVWTHTRPVYVHAKYLTEVRDAVGAARATLNVAAPSYPSGYVLSTGQVVRAAHLTETRAALR